MTHLLSITDLNTTIDRQPRIAHQRVAAALGYEQQHKLRHLIERNIQELARYGEVSSTMDETTSAGGRPGKTYYLNEPQALLVCIRSDAPRAPDARQAIIEAFIEYRRATAAPPIQAPSERQHNRRISTDRDTALRLAALVERLEKLEGGLAIDASLPLPTGMTPERFRKEIIDAMMRMVSEAATGAVAAPLAHLHPMMAFGHCLNAKARGGQP